MNRNIHKISLNQIKIEDGFWSPLQNLILDVVIPYQEKILNDEMPGIKKSHALSNFRIAAGLEEGEYYGMVFQDSDVAKWMEGAAYSLCIRPDKDLEARLDEIIEWIGRAQQEDGYLNTYFTVKEPEHRWQNLQECHELYCAGHMMEAAAAYYEAVGKDSLLRIMERMADHIDSRFGPDKERGIPGHQEVEIGLMRLYHVTGKEKYKTLAKYFIDERGQNPDYFKEEAQKRGWTHFHMDPENRKYNQVHAPVRSQTSAEGHSVRAVYMYTAMAAIAKEFGDEELYRACEVLWENITQKRMYVTGSIGSTVEGEAFSIDYDLPNDTVYGETCAAIGLVFFAGQMLDIHPDGRYADVMERALYNGVLSGMQLDGRRFFYVNPLEVNPGVSGELFGYRHVLPERPGWYECACCPPNVVRLLCSLGRYAWSESEDVIYSHLYLGGKVSLENADITVETSYPWKGEVLYHIQAGQKEKFTLAVRVPAWAKQVQFLLNGGRLDVTGCWKDGYCYIERAWGKQDTLQLIFDDSPRRVYANTAVRADAGCTAVMKGPLVYCFEGADNGEQLQSLRIASDFEAEEELCASGKLKNMVLLKIKGFRMESGSDLYSEQAPQAAETTLTAVPYFAWGNRGLNQMRVWMLEK